MSRRSLCFAVGILACVVCAVLGIVVALVRQTPDWYAKAVIPPGEERTQLSKEAEKARADLKGLIENEHEWGAKFKAEQLNAYLEEGLFEEAGTDVLGKEISDPRIAFEADRVRFGFRYGKGIRSTVISMVLKVWVPKEDSSALVLELESLQAGLLPVSAQSVLEEIARVLREKEVEISWYRLNGHPTAVVRFQTDQQHSAIQLTAIQAKDGQLVIQGRTNGNESPAPAVGPAALPVSVPAVNP